MFGVVKDLNKVLASWDQFSRSFIGREPDHIILDETTAEVHYDFEISEANLKKLMLLAEAYKQLTGITIIVYPKGYYKESLIMKNL